MQKVGFFERIFFYGCEALLNLKFILPWIKDEKCDDKSEISFRKQYMIEWVLRSYWFGVLSINIFVCVLLFFELFFPSVHFVVKYVVSILPGLFCGWRIMRWSEKQYVQPYLAFKNSISEDENASLWELLAFLLMLLLPIFPFFIVFVFF